MTHQGGAGDLEAQGRFKQVGRARERGAKGLKGASGERTEELAGVNRGGGSGRLGRSIGNGPSET